MERKDIEIMAPVGSWESLMAAINAGANSIYFGVESLNMRAKSSFKFTLDDMQEVVDRCEAAGVKSYLTVNTVIFDEEFEDIEKIVLKAKETGITAVIAADIGVIQVCRENDVEVHISTQVNITNYKAVKFYSQFADVVVLAREMTMNRVREIKDQIIKDDLRGPNGKLMEIEMFVHGALCMAVSGKCYLSLHDKANSANRGACNQSCRRPYVVTDKQTGTELEIDNEYIMSPKDLKTIHFLNKVLDSGVTVLKLEGRARSPEYVKTVVECYREAVDAYIDGTYTEEKIKDWDERLSRVFNRGFWDGYYLGKRLGEWSHTHGSQATTRKVYVGKNTNYFAKIGVSEFKLESGELCVGDEVVITGPTTGAVQFKVEEIQVDMKAVDKTVKGELFAIKTPERIRRADRMYKIVSSTDEEVKHNL